MMSIHRKNQRVVPPSVYDYEQFLEVTVLEGEGTNNVKGLIARGGTE